jgi:hypothetical protein
VFPRSSVIVDWGVSLFHSVTPGKCWDNTALIRDCIFQCPSDSSFTNKHPIVSFTDGNGKVHAITMKVHEGKERCSSTLSLTSALNGCWWSTPRPGRFTPPSRERDPVPIVQEAWWVTPGQSGRVRKNLASPGIRSPDRPARSESLYRLSCPRHPHYVNKHSRKLNFIASLPAIYLFFSVLKVPYLYCPTRCMEKLWKPCFMIGTCDV